MRPRLRSRGTGHGAIERLSLLAVVGGLLLASGCGDATELDAAADRPDHGSEPGSSSPPAEPVDPLCEEDFWRGYEEGYDEGVGDVRPWVTVGLVRGYEIGLEGGDSRGYRRGYFDGLSSLSYDCDTEDDCVTGQRCVDADLYGRWCVSAPACDEPHPESDRGRCQDECFSRYDDTRNAGLCLAACACVAAADEPRRLCESNQDCRYVFKPTCDLERGLCTWETP